MIEGGRGVGTYTYMHAFVDCPDFQLTANRGSIRNTDIEKLDLIKDGINKVFSTKEIEDAIRERTEIEEMEKTIKSIQDDEKALKTRYKAVNTRQKITLPNGRVLLEPTKKGNTYNESETFALLIEIIENYPDLFPFNILDYNTTKGIDFVIDDRGNPKYIELKGMLTKKINHPFELVYKFIAYDIDVAENDVVEDMDENKTVLNKKDAEFFSNDQRFNKKKYTCFYLNPENPGRIQSMEIIKLKSLLVEVLGAQIG